jgi:hypothetical protein
LSGVARYEHRSNALTGPSGFEQAIADARLGYEQARLVGISLDLLPELANEDAQVYDWTGYYVGGFGGHAFGNHNLVNGPLTSSQRPPRTFGKWPS